jgi:hypothetical protein
VEAIGQAFLTGSGELIVQSGGKVAQLDDRDGAQLMQMLDIDGKPASDEGLMAWLERGAGRLVLRYRSQRVAVERIARDDVATRFHFTRAPSP